MMAHKSLDLLKTRSNSLVSFVNNIKNTAKEGSA